MQFLLQLLSQSWSESTLTKEYIPTRIQDVDFCTPGFTLRKFSLNMNGETSFTRVAMSKRSHEPLKLKHITFLHNAQKLNFIHWIYDAEQFMTQCDFMLK